MRPFLAIAVHLIFFATFCSMNKTAICQEKADVKFLVDNENGYFEILLDDTLLIKKYKDSLTLGSHIAQIWSYGYNTETVEFKVLPDTVNEVYVKLNRSQDFLEYEQRYDAYRMKFHKAVTLPVSSTIAVSMMSAGFMIRAFDLRKVIVSDIELYSKTSLPDEIEAIKMRVDENNSKYNVNRYGYYITGGLALAGIFTSVYTAIRFKNNNTEPVYSLQSPFDKKIGLRTTSNGVSLVIRIG